MSRIFAPLVCGLFVLAGCSGSTAPGIRPAVSVTGTVIEIDDQVPVDGGVTITLKADDGGTVLLLFESLFTYPPPGEDRLALYQKIGKLGTGSRIIATGTRVEGGIHLEDFIILKR